MEQFILFLLPQQQYPLSTGNERKSKWLNDQLSPVLCYASQLTGKCFDQTHFSLGKVQYQAIIFLKKREERYLVKCNFLFNFFLAMAASDSASLN